MCLRTDVHYSREDLAVAEENDSSVDVSGKVKKNFRLLEEDRVGIANDNLLERSSEKRKG